MKWLNASGNRIRSLDGLERMEELQVLNCSHNHLQGEVKIRGLGSLGALILNNNDIVSIAGLSSLKNLNTLVLSNNRIQELGTSLKHLVGLKKLSASHNSIREIGKSLKKCTNIQELRLGHNKITSLPKELVHNGRLRVLDLGHNLIADFAKVDALKELKELRNLNLSGNPLSSKPGYRERMLGALPWLEILDGQALQPRKGKGKKKRVFEDPIKERSAAQLFQGDGKNIKMRFDEKDEDVSPPGIETTSDPVDQQGSFLDSFADMRNVQGPERRGNPMYDLTTAKADALQTGVLKRIDAKRGSEGRGILGKEAAELLLRQAESNGWADGTETGWEDDLPLLATSEPTTIQVRPSVSHTITSPHPVASGLPKASLSKRWASGGRKKARPVSSSIA